MKANRKKLMLAMARACMDTEDLQKAAEMPRPTLNNAICGKSVNLTPLDTSPYMTSTQKNQ